jgi:hypothetical protein
MLYLEPPFHVINGISLFADHADPLQYYYLPLRPHLTLLPGPDGGSPVPQLSLVKFRGAAGNGGLLNFDIDLGIDQNLLADTASQLLSVADLRDTPNLVPVPLTDGTVALTLLGQTGDGQGGQGPRFVRRMSYSAKPALYGDNRAAFSADLDAAGVALLDSALAGELAPIAVVYSLQYAGLRPAYSVRVHADWNRVQQHLEEAFGVDELFFSADIDTVVDKLIESRVIELRVDSYIPPGEDATDLLARLDRATNEVRDHVIDTFFEPSIDPIHKERDGWDKALQVAQRLALLHATGGWSGLGGFTYKKIDITRVDRKVLDMNMTERSTVLRQVYPQAHLSGLFRGLPDPNGFIIDADLDDPWYEQRRISVVARTDFGVDQVQSLDVHLSYAGQPQNMVLDAQHPAASVTWNTAIDAGKPVRNVDIRYDVSFRGADRAERPVLLSSPTESVDVENVEVRPRELFSLLPVAVVAIGFPWASYPSVEVQTRYSDPPAGIDLQETFMLKETQPAATWYLFSVAAGRPSFEYRITYRSADHRDVVTGWQRTDDEQVTIRDPFPVKRQLDVFPAMDWDEVRIAFCDVEYRSAGGTLLDSRSLSFEKTKDQLQTVEFSLQDPERRLLTYRTTVVHRDGRVSRLPEADTADRRVILTCVQAGHRIIEVHGPSEAFATLNLTEVQVELSFEDPAAGLAVADTLSFRSESDRPGWFEFDYADEARSGYQYRVRFFYDNGLTRGTEWTTSHERNLTVDAR